MERYLKDQTVTHIHPKLILYPKPCFIDPIKQLTTIRKNLTTIIAVRCKDGIVMVADTQMTIGDRTKERGSKIDTIGQHALIGCAGTAEYIDLLVRRYVAPTINEKVSEDYYDLLKKASLDYNMGAKSIIDGLTRLYNRQEIEGLVYPQAIFGCYDDREKKYRVFELKLPSIPREILFEKQDRAVVGMGQLYAPLLFVQLESVLRRIKPVKVWSELSANLVSKIAYLIMKGVISYDLYTGGEPIIYRINEDSVRLLQKLDIFPKSQGGKTSLAELIESAIEEIGINEIKKLVEIYGFDLNVIKRILD